MQEITIRDFGPIKDITIPIRKYNVFIGSSGTGKSTLSKVICNAQWLEKELVVSNAQRPIQEDTKWYINQLTSYHGLGDYVQANSYIEYHGEFLSFAFDNSKSSVPFTYTLNRDLASFVRKKTLYVPAERNMVAVIPNWFEIKLPDNNLRGYLSSWEDARKFFSPRNPLDLPLFNAKYFSSDNGALDVISFSDGKTMLLEEVASGVQASVPLSVLVEYYSSPERAMRLTSVRGDMTFEELTAELLTITNAFTEDAKSTLSEERKQQLRKLAMIKGTSFFIEEPELNLFPLLQYKLLDKVIAQINDIKDNCLTITTHSPYILAFLSNYIYAYHLQYNMSIDVTHVVPKQQMISMDDMSAYFLNDGCATSLLHDPTLGIEIRDLDQVSEDINKTWDLLLQSEMNNEAN